VLSLWGLALAAGGAALGLTVGEVEARSARVWAAGDGPGVLRVELRRVDGPGPRIEAQVPLGPGATGQVHLTGLRPDSSYEASAWVEGESAAPRRARFRTPPSPRAFQPVHLAWGGDLGGQNACRHATEGYPVFDTLRFLRPDLFVALGDMIYADDTCTAEGRFGYPQVPGPPRAATVEAYRDWWRYNLEDPGWRAVRAQTPVVGVWDDHEVVNDFGPGRDTRSQPPYTAGVPLLPIGEQAFREHMPLPERLHRSLRWGKALELVVLDTRSHRSPNPDPDTPGKTMLGEEQRAWAVETLTTSDAVWKLVVSSVPLVATTGRIEARAGWSPVGGTGGYLSELRALYAALADVRNLVFLTTDVHYAAAFRHRPLPDRPDLVLHELIAGPLNAGLFPNQKFQPDMGAERLFFHGPASADAVRDWEEALGWFNVGSFQVNADRSATVRWLDARGRVVGELRLPDQRGVGP